MSAKFDVKYYSDTKCGPPSKEEVDLQKEDVELDEVYDNCAYLNLCAIVQKEGVIQFIIDPHGNCWNKIASEP